jgi:hypothetical protein
VNGHTGLVNGHGSTGKIHTGHHEWATETREFYFEPPSTRKSVWSFVRELCGPHFSTCAWRPVDDCGKLLGDSAAATALLDRLLHDST